MELPVFDPRALYLARLSKGLSRAGLAGRSGLSRETIRRAELGKFDPQAETLLALATALEVPVVELMIDRIAA